MGTPVISVEGVGKRYTLLHKQEGNRGLRHVLNDALTAPFRAFKGRGKEGTEIATPDKEDFWALKDVSFEVNQGDVVAIVGRNGAGKSTLLKVLSRITEPTEGRIRIRGRVASLLEVGTGFHPELSGRENIYLNGAILGMGRAEIRRKFDEIVAFAEVERFLDTPVKRYSSGMYVRLAFAVAAHLEPEILIVDEVLAVGDAQFQKKCLGKMGEVAANEGRTILFVSHNMATVLTLCNRGILLVRGTSTFQGTAREAADLYLESGAELSGETRWNADEAPTGRGVVLRGARIVQGGKVASEVAIDEPFRIEIDYELLESGRPYFANFHLIDRNGIEVLSAVNWPAANLNGRAMVPDKRGQYRAICEIPGNLLNDGLFTLHLFLLNTSNVADVEKREALKFHVYDTGAMRADGYHGAWCGVIRPRFTWDFEEMGRL